MDVSATDQLILLLRRREIHEIHGEVVKVSSRPIPSLWLEHREVTSREFRRIGQVCRGLRENLDAAEIIQADVNTCSFFHQISTWYTQAVHLQLDS